MGAEGDITRLLQRYTQGDALALDELTPIVYAELRRLARSHFQRERGNHTLQPTALIHEAYLRFVDQGRRDWESRSHFFFFSSHLMRQILVDHARSNSARKRGGEFQRVTLDESPELTSVPDMDVLVLNHALDQLAVCDERKARIVELRYFGGMTTDEIAATMGVSESTIRRDLRVAIAWLHREMQRE